MNKKVLYGLIVGLLFLFLLILTLINANALEPLALDKGIYNYFIDHRGNKNGFWYYFARIVTEFGHYFAILIITIFFAVITRGNNISLSYLIGLIVMILANLILKKIIDRPRPDVLNFWQDETRSSFPSGHSMICGYLYSYLIYYILKRNDNRIVVNSVCITSGVIMALVPISRLIMGVHYFTDVVGGILCGALIAVIFMVISEIMIEHNFLNTPLLDTILKKDKKEDNTKE